MKNTFWPHTGRVLVQGLLLLCLRLAQNRTGFDPVTGLSVRSVPGLALIACLLLCARERALREEERYGTES